MTPCAKCRESVERNLKLTWQENAMLRASLDHQNQAILQSLAAMDKGEYGTARRILKTGSERPPIASTGVIAKDGA